MPMIILCDRCGNETDLYDIISCKNNKQYCSTCFSELLNKMRKNHQEINKE